MKTRTFFRSLWGVFVEQVADASLISLIEEDEEQAQKVEDREQHVFVHLHVMLINIFNIHAS